MVHFHGHKRKHSCAGGGSNTAPARPDRSISGHCGPSTGTHNSRSGMSGSGVRPMRGMYSTAARPPVTPFASTRSFVGVEIELARPHQMSHVKLMHRITATDSGIRFLYVVPPRPQAGPGRITPSSALNPRNSRGSGRKTSTGFRRITGRITPACARSGAIYRWVLKGCKAPGACRSGPGRG